MKNKGNKKDLLLIIVILAAVGILYIGNRILFQSPAKLVTVSVDGKLTETLDLYKDTQLTIDGYGGESNQLIIENGEVWMTDATCPDKVCIRQGKIHSSGESIICLPNRVVIRITGD